MLSDFIYSFMEVICLETEAFYKLIDEVIDRLEARKPNTPNKWIGTMEAMEMLKVTSKTTLQKYRDQGDIRFTQPSRKIILYDRDSIKEFLERNSKDTY